MSDPCVAGLADGAADGAVVVTRGFGATPIGVGFAEGTALAATGSAEGTCGAADAGVATDAGGGGTTDVAGGGADVATIGAGGAGVREVIANAATPTTTVTAPIP